MDGRRGRMEGVNGSYTNPGDGKMLTKGEGVAGGQGQD